MWNVKKLCGLIMYQNLFGLIKFKLLFKLILLQDIDNTVWWQDIDNRVFTHAVPFPVYNCHKKTVEVYVSIFVLICQKITWRWHKYICPCLAVMKNCLEGKVNDDLWSVKKTHLIDAKTVSCLIVCEAWTEWLTFCRRHFQVHFLLFLIEL